MQMHSLLSLGRLALRWILSRRNFEMHERNPGPYWPIQRSGWKTMFGCLWRSEKCSLHNNLKVYFESFTMKHHFWVHCWVIVNGMKKIIFSWKNVQKERRSWHRKISSIVFKVKQKKWAVLCLSFIRIFHWDSHSQHIQKSLYSCACPPGGYA